jgi:multidrug efflux pump subunit AcrB
VVDTDIYTEAPQQQFDFLVDQEKAGIHGVGAAEVANTLAVAGDGVVTGLAHDPEAPEDVPVKVRLRQDQRHSIAALGDLRLTGTDGALLDLETVAARADSRVAPSIYHKNLEAVVYVVADVAGSEESPVYAILQLNKALDHFNGPAGRPLERYNVAQPSDTSVYGMKWDGEWQITYEVFRDLGLAFAVVLVLIYALVVGWFRSFVTPLVIMSAIPFSLVGILPAHWAGGVFFSATSMIGFIAGAGIVVRNSIILVDFINLRLDQGMPLEEAVVDAGAVRFRPMLLTALAVVIGTAVILLDPIFQGLAVALMAGEVASLLLSRMAVPLLYYLSLRPSHRRPAELGWHEPDWQALHRRFAEDGPED